MLRHAARTMQIRVGSHNSVKLAGVQLALAQFKIDSDIEALAAASGVSEQPLSRDETIEGATNRAAAIWREGCLAIGLEDGLMQVPQARGGAMNICVCSLYDGRDHHIGFSSAFQFPPAVMERIREEGCDLSQAFQRAALTEHENIGAAQGAIGLLTDGVLDRSHYVAQAVIAAMAAYRGSKL